LDLQLPTGFSIKSIGQRVCLRPNYLLSERQRSLNRAEPDTDVAEPGKLLAADIPSLADDEWSSRRQRNMVEVVIRDFGGAVIPSPFEAFAPKAIQTQKLRRTRFPEPAGAVALI
jgi:hypothetical protein